jgi:hypothetical protein
MLKFLEEIILVVPRSTKTIVAGLLGPISFLIIAFMWTQVSKGFVSSGFLAEAMIAVRDGFAQKYLVLALCAWASFWFVAIRAYFRDRKRILGY